MAVSPERPIDLAARAARVLRDNDLGGWTKASPRLYPHQWSWDSAFIAIGWARLDPVRAAAELRSLFARQWANGMVPHIVFNPAIPPGSYFPGPERWATADLSDPAPSGPPFTSGLCQPPVHAIAAYRIWLVAHEGDEPDRTEIASFLREIYPRLLAWHRYLATARDPERSGLVTIYHPWEGTDNSPRWDDALAAIEVGEVETYARTDLALVADQSQRPTKAEYDRYLWLVDALKRARYDDASIQRTHPFQIKDVLFSAIAVAANVALLAIAGIVGAADQERAIIAGWIERGRRGLDEQWDEGLGLALDHDLRRAAPIATRTVAGFAPLIAGGLSSARMAALLKMIDSEAFCGHPDLRWPVPPSTSPLDSGFRARSYWRGPTWPVMNWLLWWALEELGEKARAAALRRASLDQLASVGFAEYVEPFTGEPLGSAAQSWTAAVALDWLANEEA